MSLTRDEILTEIARNFAMISNVTVSIYDANRNQIASGSDNISFCAAVRRKEPLYKKCIECDKMGFGGCAATKKPYMYHCHMGLVEITVPIMFADTLIGYIIIGQFSDQPDKSQVREAVIKAADRYGFNADNLLTYIESITCPTDAYINALAQLTQMCAGYIWLNNILHLSGSNMVMEIRLYITSHLEEELSVESICSKYGLSATALYQMFKKSFGSGITQIIREERINKAKELLKQPKISVGEVASRVGIADANYFARTFKAMTGVSPKEYKKSNFITKNIDN